LGLESTPGLSTVLAGDATLEDALREVEPFGDRLRVLPGGPPPPNPSELLGSVRMAKLFDETIADSDLVIVDTPPLLVVSDAFGLLERASGAIGVARLDQTPKDAAARMAEVVKTVHTRLLGAVATGSLPVAAYGYGYGYGYGSTPPSPEPLAATDVSGNGHPTPPPHEQSSSGRLAKLFRSG
jgi:Mrp family chromosome partitioning ATPase